MTDEQKQVSNFEKACRKLSMVPVEKIDTKYGEILIADGCDGKRYRSAFCISRGGLDIFHDMEFDLFHNPEIPRSMKQKARINTVKKEALKWIGHNVEAGRYDA